MTVFEACNDGLGDVVHWAPAPGADDVNPEAQGATFPVPWPAVPEPGRLAALQALARAVSDVASHQPALPGFDDHDSAPADVPASESAAIARWDLLTAALIEEARAHHVRERMVRLPDSVSASLLMRALADPAAVALDLARPMPHPPAPAARRGTEFHAWVETRFGQQSLLDPDDLPGAADADIISDEQLSELKAAFEGGSYAHLTPVAVEAPFALLVGGRVVNGRIDAVFETGPGRYDVIDWKTGSARHVDPMQLALYRLAWAALMGAPVEHVDAAFVIVGTGEVVRPDTAAEVALLLAQ
jgi:DNA helicase-2/ATP-dependent DNA helicase PcrA